MATRAKTTTAGDSNSTSRSSKGAKPSTKGKTNPARPAAEGPSITAKNTTPEEKRFLTRHENKLSPTTLRAKWTHSADDHADRPGQTLATRSHDVIRQWAEERGGVPATVGAKEGRPRVLRLNFPDRGGRNLQEISWEEWFETFDDRKLVFLYQERMKSGNQSNFFRFDSPEREHA